MMRVFGSLYSSSFLRFIPRISNSRNRLARIAVPWLSVAVVLGVPAASAQTRTATTTALTVTANGGAVTKAVAGTVVTLTASVNAGTAALTTGQVNFCDATAKYCTDIHVLGMAQLTSAGTATLKFRPGVGRHSYKAVFLGTNTDAGSSSGASALAITGPAGPFASASSIAESGSWGNYALTATVTEAGQTTAPTGTVSFLDASQGNAVLATGTLGPAVAGIAWPNPKSINLSDDNSFVQVSDLNGDGIPDLLVNENPLEIYLGNADGTYTLAPAPATGGIPTGPMVVADFNGDGIPDVALAMYYSPGLSILLGKGDGTFAAPVQVTLPNATDNASQILTADFNGDGIADLAVVDSYDSQLTILLGNGDGTFTTAAAPPISIRPAGVALGDFNGDGKIDLAVAASESDSITILLGNGDGTFSTGSTVNSGVLGTTSGGLQIVAADFNGDGKLDLAVGAGAASNAESVIALTGNGDGTFNSPAAGQTPVSSIVSYMQVADFNQDGVPDVVMSDTNGSATVFLNDGTGTFSAGDTVVTGLRVAFGLQVGVGDLNGDGYPDIATAGYYDSTLWLYLTQPTETATASAAISLPAGLHQADSSYAGDTNYTASVSGTLPLWGVPLTTTTTLTVTSGGKAVTSVAPGTAVTLTATVKVAANPVTAGLVNFCDASAAHCTDVHIVGAAALTSSGTATFKFVPGAGTHSYKAEFVENGYGASSASNAVSLTVGPAPSPVYSDATALVSSNSPGNYTLTATVTGFGGAAPLTGNVSFLDTSFANTNLGTVALGPSTAAPGWLISQSPALSNAPVGEVAGDFNGDGIPDLAVIWFNSAAGGYSVSIFFGAGNGTFTTGPTTAATGVQTFSTMVAADFNGDGKPDLAIMSTTGGDGTLVTVMLSNGDGTFAAPLTTQAYTAPLTGGDIVSASMVAADFNGDGKTDLALVGGLVGSGEVTTLLGNGDGTFTSSVATYGNSSTFNVVATGDFNGDGIPDLVVANYFAPSGAFVLLGKGDGTFTAVPATIPVDTFVHSIVAGDFNGDGVLDLAFGYNGGVGVFLGNGDGTFKQVTGSPFQGPGSGLVAGDFNHDGKLDLAAYGSFGTEVDLYIGAGDGTFTETNTVSNANTDSDYASALVVADFNGDGVPDVAMLTDFVDTASILLAEPTQTATATLNGVAPVGAGTHNVEASYAGDSNYPASVSTTVALTAGLTPVSFSPPEGTYSTAQQITLTEQIPGATIYYEAFGIVNTNGYVAYSGPISLNEGGFETIVAYATETGYQSSNYAYANYTMNFPQAPAPTFSIAAGVYAGPQSVKIIDAAANATIYYTTNGTTPTMASTQYTVPITVSASEVLSALAIAPGYSLSSATTANYVISSAATPFIDTVAGTYGFGYAGDGGLATAAELNDPTDVAFDSAGNLYIADGVNNVVRKVAAGTGVISTVAGTSLAGYTGDGGPAAAANLQDPTAVAFDHSGNLYIADTGNCAIRKVSASTGDISTYVGGGCSSSSSVSDPGGLAVDAAGNLYISNGSKVEKVAASTGTVTTYAGGGSGTGGTGSGGPATSAALSEPVGLALDGSGNLFIADYIGNVIWKVDASTQVITIVAGNGYGANLGEGGYTGDGGPATSAELYLPTAVAVDRAGNLFISDSSNRVIREVTASTGIISTVIGNGNACYGLSGDGGPAGSAFLCYPQGLAFDGSGNLYLADESLSSVRIATMGAPPAKAAAAPVFSMSGSTYSGPQSVSLSDATPGAAIYVTYDGSTPTTLSDQYRGAINVNGSVTLSAVAVAPGYLPSSPVSATYTITTPPPAVVSTVAGSGARVTQPAAGLPATSTSFASVNGPAVDAAGNIYIPDAYDAVVWKVSRSTGIATIVAGSLDSPGYTGDGGPATSAQMAVPQAVALDSSGNLYIADTGNRVVRKVIAATGIITTYAGNYLYGSSLGDGGPATAAQISPLGLAFDAANNLYIADGGHMRVRKVTASTGIISTVAGGASFSAPLGDGGPATSARVLDPVSVALDAQGDLYIGETGDLRVRYVDAATGIISTIAGNGDRGSSGDGLPATQAEIDPLGLALDASGDLYIADGSVVRELAAGSSVLTTIAGNGYVPYDGDGRSATLSAFCDPNGVAFDGSGNLLVSDYCDLRIRKVAFSNAAATPTYSVAAGAFTAGQSVEISDTTPGATIYYTTNGSTPTIHSNIYSAAIAVNQSETLKAMATADGYANSAVATATYTIGMVTPSVTVTPSATSITIEQPLSVTVAVSGGTGNPTPTGSITLTSGPFTAQQTLSGGSATFSLVAGALPAGIETLTASYSPDSGSAANFNPASGRASVTVTKLTPTVALTPSATSITTAQPLSVTVSVSGGSGNPAPAGTITLTSGSYSAQQTLSAGSATFSVAAGALSAGTDTLTAAYAPDSTSSETYTTAMQSTTVSVTTPIGTAVAAVTVTPSLTDVTNAQAVTVAVAVTGTSGEPTPTGTVTLSAGNWSSQQPLTNGGASFTVPAGTLSAGSNTLTATYSGDATYAVASNTSTITVSAVVSRSQTPSPVSPGSDTTSAITVTAGTTYSGTMNLTCALTSSPTGAQSLPTCSMKPTSITLAAGGKATSTLTVKTTAESTSAQLQPDRGLLRWLGGGGASLAVVLLFGIPARRRRWTSMLVLLAAICVFGAIGCGGGGGGNGGGGQTIPATTAGNYTFTVTGTDTANAQITTSTTVVVTVQ